MAIAPGAALSAVSHAFTGIEVPASTTEAPAPPPLTTVVDCVPALKSASLVCVTEVLIVESESVVPPTIFVEVAAYSVQFAGAGYPVVFDVSVVQSLWVQENVAASAV